MFTIYCDFETTGLNPYMSEIIEGYFEVYLNDKMIDFYEFKSQVDIWSDDAAAIHKIDYVKTLSYPIKTTAFRNLLEWLSNYKEFTFITYTNKNTEFGHLNYDVAILENELMLLGCPPYYLKNKYRMMQNYSVHSLARQCVNSKLFMPIRGESGRASLTQENVYKALFSDIYDSHNAKEDVKALVRIHRELVRLQDENQNLFNWTYTDNS